MARKTLIIMAMATLMLPTAFSWAADNQPKSSPQALTLEQCLELAYANNQELKAAQQSVVVAKEKVKQAQGAFLPTVDYQLGGAKNSDSNSYPYSYSSGTVKNNDGNDVDLHQHATKEGSDTGYSGTLSATQYLYTGGKLSNGLKIAKLSLDVALEKERQAKQKLAYSVKESYHRTWLAEEYLNVANASYENLAHHADQIEKLFKVGNTSKFELLRAQVQRDKLKPTVIKAQNGSDLAELALTTLIGVKKDASFSIAFEPDKVTLPEAPAGSLETALNSAYQNRSELKQIQLATQINEVQVAMAKADLRPKVGLTGSYTGQGEEFQPGDWNKSWSLKLGVQGNLFNASKRPEIAAGKAEVELQKIQEQALKDGIRLEVEQVLQNIKENLETAKSTQANIALSKEALRLTEVRFQAGMATTMDVKDAQLALDDALNGYYQSVAAYLTAVAKLELVTGQGK